MTMSKSSDLLGASVAICKLRNSTQLLPKVVPGQGELTHGKHAEHWHGGEYVISITVLQRGLDEVMVGQKLFW